MSEQETGEATSFLAKAWKNYWTFKNDYLFVLFFMIGWSCIGSTILGLSLYFHGISKGWIAFVVGYGVSFILSIPLWTQLITYQRIKRLTEQKQGAKLRQIARRGTINLLSKKLVRAALRDLGQATPDTAPIPASVQPSSIPTSKVYQIEEPPPGTRCMVSHLEIHLEMDELVACPYCEGIAKKELLEEWLEENYTCPVCRRTLRIEECPIVQIKEADRERNRKDQ